MWEKQDIDFLDDDFDEEDEDTMQDKYLTFHIGNEIYGIEIHHVIEIVGMQKITSVPDMPEYVKGVINLRGKVIPVMDVRARFHMEVKPYHERTCVIVILVGDTSIGLVVDTVDEVTDIPEENISPPPDIGNSSKNRYIKGMGKFNDEVKILLDVNKLLFEEDLALLDSTI